MADEDNAKTPPWEVTICEHCGKASFRLSLYKIPTLARLFGVSEASVRAWIRDGLVRWRAWIWRGRMYRIIPADEVIKLLDYRMPWGDRLDPDSPNSFNRAAYKLRYHHEHRARKGGLARQDKARKAREQKDSQS